MRIHIIGGGPAGLYFAILMKKRDPRHRIAILERNRPNDTFGWGVVFSDKTMSYLRDSDAESYSAITQYFQLWDNVNIVHRDETITIRGNTFSGITRITLLNILQRRCLDLGAEIHFETNVSDLDAVADCDLLVGADGINSLVRQRYSDAFQASLATGRSKYIWLGTHQLFHGITLTFRKTDAGHFAAHAYKYSPTTSTFIVECPEDTWRRAGLDEMSDEESGAYLAEVFRKDLEGNPLLSNNSRWINFLLVKNGRWRHQNVVLLGDALHTAHFSIGSGTKLALEDAIALAGCFAAKRDVVAALEEFERVRKPVVDDLQDAAHESLRWFENFPDDMHLDPMRFAFRVMTRSGKVDYENLKKRDPEFIAAYEQATQSQ